MTDWSLVFLGVIAAATAVMALIQIGAIIAGAAMARRTRETLDQAQQAIGAARQTLAAVHEELRPLIAKANDIAGEASRTATLARAQGEKVDRLVTDLSRRVDETTALVQQAIVTPAREGLAVMAAIRAGLGALRMAGDFRRRTRRSEEEDPLFIG